MMNCAPFDPRAIANELLAEAKSSEFEVTNLSLQKLLYLVHAIFLIEKNTPLVRGYFEAWKYGPVHPAVYETFKQCGRSPIKSPAVSFNYATQSSESIPKLKDVDAKRIIKRVVNSFGGMSPSQLVSLTHAKGGAWEKTVNKAATSVALGLRINDTDTRELYGKMKLDLSESKTESFYENSPFA